MDCTRVELGVVDRGLDRTSLAAEVQYSDES
jgi:hypothetical protein